MTSRIFLSIFLVYFFGFFAHTLYLKKTVYGDGIFYYSWLRSAVVDHDFNFSNEYAHFGANQPLASNGLPGNKYAVGPAILWTPTFFWVHLIMKGSGFELPYQLAVGVASVLYAFTGLVLLYRLLRQLFNEQISLLTICSLALSTNLFYYGSLDPVNSHGLSFFAACVFLSLLFAQKRNWFLIGLSLGLVALIRPQDFVYVILMVPLVKLRQLPAAILGFLCAFLPQLIAWQILYGKFWISPYLSGNEYFNFAHPHFFEVLFSPWYGLFFFSPILILGLIGLFIWKNKIRATALIVILLELLLISSWSTWWQGAAVGSRMLVAVIPIFGLGLGYFLTGLTKKLEVKLIILTMIAPLSALNFLLTFSYLVLH